MTSRATCRWCGAPIRWVATEAAGRPMCLDPQPSPTGNVALISTKTGPRARVLKAEEIAGWRAQRWMPHAATCPAVRTRIGTKRQI